MERMTARQDAELAFRFIVIQANETLEGVLIPIVSIHKRGTHPVHTVGGDLAFLLVPRELRRSDDL